VSSRVRGLSQQEYADAIGGHVHLQAIPHALLAAGERIPPFARLEVVADRNAGGLVALVQLYQRSLVRAAFLVDAVEHRQVTLQPFVELQATLQSGG
jgi:hypothetical protein